MTIKIRPKVDQIKEIFPHEVEIIQVRDNGDDFLVIELNQEWMFCFPRNASAGKALHCERQFLPRFEKVSPLPIPQFRYLGEDFVGYRKIEGALLTTQLFRTLRRETLKRIARQIGEFLSALHAFPLEEALKIGLTEGYGDFCPRDHVFSIRNGSNSAGLLT